MQTSNIYQDIDSEEQVLQAIYLNPELIYQIDITSQDFTNTLHKELYEALLTIYSDGMVVDLATIKDTKPEISILKVSDLFSKALTSANIKYHSNKIMEATFNRKCKETLKELISQLGNHHFLETIERTVTELYEVQNRKKDKNIKEVLEKVKDCSLEAKKTGKYGIPTGFHKLNSSIVGLCPQHFWIIGGYTSHGKSTLLSQIIHDICSKNHKMIVFSVEDSVSDKLTRLIATTTQIPIVSIVKGIIDTAILDNAIQTISQYNLYIYDDIYNLDEMDLKIKKHKLQGGVDIVAIDFVQNILTGGESIYERMSEVAIKLQRMAKKHNICMIGLSQISKDKEKGSISLRGAQELASSADIVLWIDREQDKQDFNLIVRKNRPFGITGKFPCRFTESWTNIKEAY
jgi:replicative DNA helicase